MEANDESDARVGAGFALGFFDVGYFYWIDILFYNTIGPILGMKQMAFFVMASLIRGKEAGKVKNTLQTLAVLLTAIVVVGCSREMPPEEKALKFVEESQALGGNQSVKVILNKWIKEKREEIKAIGWGVSKKHDQVYMVSFKYKIYSFKEGTGESGFFFEVDLDSGSVRNVTKEIVQKMGSLSPSFKGEGEIPKQLMKKLDEEGKMLPGGEPQQALPVPQ